MFPISLGTFFFCAKKHAPAHFRSGSRIRWRLHSFWNFRTFMWDEMMTSTRVRAFVSSKVCRSFSRAFRFFRAWAWLTHALRLSPMSKPTSSLQSGNEVVTKGESLASSSRIKARSLRKFQMSLGAWFTHFGAEISRTTLLSRAWVASQPARNEAESLATSMHCHISNICRWYVLYPPPAAHYRKLRSSKEIQRVILQ